MTPRVNAWLLHSVQEAEIHIDASEKNALGLNCAFLAACVSKLKSAPSGERQAANEEDRITQQYPKCRSLLCGEKFQIDLRQIDHPQSAATRYSSDRSTRCPFDPLNPSAILPCSTADMGEDQIGSVG